MNAKRSTEKRTVCGAPCWQIAASTVEAYVTEQGGHLAPVVFDRQGRRIQPFAIAPWWNEPLPDDLPPILKVLRGDFFCMPFGANQLPFGQEKHPPHGETANRKWKFEEICRHRDRVTLHLSLRTRIRPGRVDKRISLVDGHQVVYCQHVISGMGGPMSLGHHATLAFPDEPASGLISTSAIKYGMATPEPVERPEARGYSVLEPGTRFRRLDRVRLITRQFANLTRYPARRGFEDIVLLVTQPREPFAWTAVTFPSRQYVWFALKDPRILKQTLLWMSNGGRHYAPWSGRHVNVMGLEELTSYFHYGLAESVRPNRLSRSGVATCHRLNPGQPLVVNYIMAIASIPRGFDKVKDIAPVAERASVTLKANSGAEVTVPLDYGFLSAP